MARPSSSPPSDRRVTVEITFTLDRESAAGSGPFDEGELARTLLQRTGEELVELFNQGAVTAPQIRVTERRRRSRP